MSQGLLGPGEWNYWKYFEAALLFLKGMIFWAAESSRSFFVGERDSIPGLLEGLIF